MLADLIAVLQAEHFSLIRMLGGARLLSHHYAVAWYSQVGRPWAANAAAAAEYMEMIRCSFYSMHRGAVRHMHELNDSCSTSLSCLEQIPCQSSHTVKAVAILSHDQLVAVRATIPLGLGAQTYPKASATHPHPITGLHPAQPQPLSTVDRHGHSITFDQTPSPAAARSTQHWCSSQPDPIPLDVHIATTPPPYHRSHRSSASVDGA